MSCPICGREDQQYPHHCPPAVLKAIDAANTRAMRDEDHGGGRKSYSSRLREGFGMKGEEE
jgi:hypothetical protein